VVLGLQDLDNSTVIQTRRKGSEQVGKEFRLSVSYVGDVKKLAS
jgi:hypothetical protein